MKEGGVILTKINVPNKYPYRYSTMIFKKQKIEQKPIYSELLQNKLANFEDLLCSFFPEAFRFFINHFKNVSQINNHEYGLMSDILEEYNLQWKNGAPLIDELINELKGREIDKETFDYLLSIINHQKDMTDKIMTKELSIDRIEFVFNHIKNAPYYLKTYLEINKIPKVKDKKIFIKSVKGEWERELRVFDYKFQDGGKKYFRGA